MTDEPTKEVEELLDAIESLIRLHGLYYGEPLHYEFTSPSVLALLVRYNRMEWVLGYKGERARFVGEYRMDIA